jgi:glutamate dehydrogenase
LDLSPDLLHAFATALIHGAAPGEIEGLTPEHTHALAKLAAATAACRTAGQPAIQLERHGDGGSATRSMTLAIVNDDMPFLVDSLGLAVAAAGLESRRLLHPIIDVARDATGHLIAPPVPANGPSPRLDLTRESLIVIEVERASGGVRQRLVEEISHVLADVRAAVTDWRAMSDAVRNTAHRLHEMAPPSAPHVLAEDIAFLEWLASDNFTLLGYRGYRVEGDTLVLEPGGLGILADPARRIWHGTGVDDQPEPTSRFLARRQALLVAKADLVSTVHRRVNCDYISVARYDPAGRIVGEDRFIGLFTSAGLHASPRAIPLLRRRVGQVIHDLGFDPRGHNGKALVHVLESFPRDELFQVEAPRLREMALGLLSLIDRPRPKLFIRADPFGRQVSALVYIPRDIYTAEIRRLIGEMLEREVGAGLDHFDVELRSDGLARIQYVIGLDGARVPQFDEPALCKRVLELVRGWDEALEVELAARVGHTRAARIALTQARIFSTSYRAQFSATEAADDILRLSELARPGEHNVHLYRRVEDAPRQLRLKIYHLETIIPLSNAVPVLENFGFRVIEEYPFDVDTDRRGWIHDFLIELPAGTPPEDAALETRIGPALRAVLNGSQENDAFNALVVDAGLDAGQVAGFRALYRYMRQTGAIVTELTVVGALRRNAPITRDLLALFRARFDPAEPHHARTEATTRDAVIDALADVVSIDDDRVLRFYLAAIQAMLRTNAYAPAGREALAFKFDSKGVPGLPAPIPYREIFVYSPRVEGIHLRAGPIARGGLRWSDRRDDFRTEVLGLLKAQIVKNAVIVPTGSKGGFYPKLLPPASDRTAWLAEGTECYRVYIRALFSITDNLVDGQIVPPADVIRHDGDDPYLVVAADKGTATFSDIANGLAIERDFWLGDAFASGGSVGYDHKAMGITARGAWISVERHFAEMGHDVQTQPTRVVGVGDMSGDVFGNGMLLSKALRLIAAFDHRHIFLDPDPDPLTSHAERARLFTLPRSSWDDYDHAVLSPGGGVFARTQKSIPLSPEVQRALGVSADALAPTDLIRAILQTAADLLWFGGIGTYVKAEDESNEDVGDRANDANRVDAEALRVKVIGEGANLAITQAARIAFARSGGRINTDFIDNSAGVDTSDHEVNIKIALQTPARAGTLPEADRIALLASMAADVAVHVLDDNRRQTLALSVAEREGAASVPAYTRVIQTLEERSRLDRRVEGLPTDDLLAQRAQGGAGLVRPELAVLLAHTKMAIYEALVASSVVDDPLLEADLLAAFPRALAERFPEAIRTHRLRREIIGTGLANALVNRAGIALPFQLAEEHGVGLACVAAAFLSARDLFDFDALWAALDALPPGKLQLRLYAEATDGLRLQMADILGTYHGDLAPSRVIDLARPGIARIEADLATILRPEPRAAITRLHDTLAKLGADEDVIRRIARLTALDGGVATAELAATIDASEVQVARAYTAIGQMLGLDWAKGRAAALNPADPWERLVVATAGRDFEQLRFDLIRRIAPPGTDPARAADAWAAANPASIARVQGTIARARHGAATTAPMLAHIAAQARAALAT